MLNNKLIWVLMIFLLIIVPSPILAEENEANVEDILEEQLTDLSLEDINTVVDRFNRDVDQVIPTLSFGEMLREFISGRFQYDWKKFFEVIWKTLFKEILANMRLLGQLLVLAVIASLLKILPDAFKNPGVSRLSNGFIYLVLVIIALNSFAMATKIGIETITNMVDFMHALLPTLFTLLISIGAVGTATIFQPIIFLIVSLISTIIKTVVFPLISLAVVLSVVSSFTGEFKLSKMGSFIKQIGITILGLSLVVFFGALFIQGAAVSVADSISLRAAKYLTGSFVPIVGGMFADALELVIGCSVFIQNAVGIIGLLIIFVMVSFPIIKILALVLIYKFVSAVIEPIGEKVIVECVNNLGNTMMLIFLSVTTVAIMFFIVITIMVGMANLTVMMR